MLQYLLIIGLSVLATFVVNALLAVTIADFSVVYALLSVLIYSLLLFGFDALIATIIHKLPAKYFDPHRKIFHVFAGEAKLIKKLGIMRWKDVVPDMGQLCDFKKGKVETLDQKYLYKFLVEMGYAEMIHIGMALSGIPIFFICPAPYILNFALPLFVLNVFLQIPPILIQRYNLPRMLKIYETLERKNLIKETKNVVAREECRINIQ